jgi:hypothetical protein
MIKCGECQNQAFIPFDDQIVVDHLQGRKVVGVKPLLEDETCWFLAACRGRSAQPPYLGRRDPCAGGRSFADPSYRAKVYSMLEDNLDLPFQTDVLGVRVMVERIDLTDREEIVVICTRDRARQAISLLELPIPVPPPQGAEWIEAFRRWARGRR